MSDYHADRCRDYGDADFYEFLFAELQPLVQYALREWNDNADILMTDFEFKVGQMGKK